MEGVKVGDNEIGLDTCSDAKVRNMRHIGSSVCLFFFLIVIRL